MQKNSASDVVHLDRAGLRCLAHPLRARLLSELRLAGPATSAQLAKRLDTNTGATSYHLRQLADVGLVVEAPELGTGRERFWQAPHQFTSWVETDFDDDPDDRAAADWLAGHYERTKQEWRQGWLRQRGQADPAWREAAGGSDVRLFVTPSQLQRLHRELVEVARRHLDAGPDEPTDGEPEADEVMVLIEGFPLLRPEPR